MEQDRTEIKVLDNGFVRLDGVHADDLSVVNSARVSFGKHKQELETEDTKLINFLMREQHGTPFEHNFFRFHVKAPIFVAREWFRHRIGWSYNEYSGRYSVINNEYYTPADEDMRTQVGKPGNYTFEQMEEWDTGIAKAVLKRAYYNAHRILRNNKRKSTHALRRTTRTQNSAKRNTRLLVSNGMLPMGPHARNLQLIPNKR